MTKTAKNQKTLIWLLLLAFAMAFCSIGNTASADEIKTVSNGDVITENGTYQVKSTASGTINIVDDLEVKLIGSGVRNNPNENLTIECGENVKLTIEDLYICNSSSKNVINFQGE